MDVSKAGNEPSSGPAAFLDGQAAIKIASANLILKRAVQHLLSLRTFDMALAKKP